jgi:hypothetical protein
MSSSVIVFVVVVVVLVLLALCLHVVHQYEKGVVFRFGRVVLRRSPDSSSSFRSSTSYARFRFALSRCRFSRRASSPATT